MKKDNKKTIATLALAGALAFAPMASEAASYKDVGAEHWAYSHISKLGDLNIVRGYVDGTFKPSRSVSYLEIMQLLKGIQNPSARDITQAISHYGTVVDQYEVPGWARGAVCVALENGVISETNLKAAHAKGFITDQPKAGQFPNREMILVYYAKALGITPKKDTSNIKVEDIDALGQTPTSLTGDVDIKGLYAAMIDTEIFHALGSDGRFNPQEDLKREQMAKITDLSYDYKKIQREVATYTGEVYFHETMNGTPTFAIKDKQGRSFAFILMDNTKITREGKPVEAKDIALGSTVEVKAYADATGITSLRAVSVEIADEDIVGTGIVKSIDDETITVEYVTGEDVAVDSSFKPDKTLRLTWDKDVPCKILGEKGDPRTIALRDMVRFKAKDGALKEVEVFPYQGTVIGEFVDYHLGSLYGGKGKMDVKLADGKIYSFNVTDDKLSQDLREWTKTLKKGTRLSLKTSYENLLAVDEVGQKLNGAVKEINFSTWRGYTLVLDLGNGEESYPLSKTVRFSRDEKSENVAMTPEQVFDALESNKPYQYIVDVDIKGGEIVGITLLQKLEKRDHSIAIYNVRPANEGESWWSDAQEGMSAYSFEVLDPSGTYGDYKELKRVFRVKTGSSVEQAILKNKQGKMTLTVDVYTKDGKYHFQNPRLSGNYGLDHVSVIFK